MAKSFKIYALILLLAQLLFAQSNVRFEHLSEEQGLSHNYITCILKDSRGFMWFCTENGLNRYDGKDFKVYKHDPEDSNSLSHNQVQSILEDKDGNLWIGTYGGGLNKFELATEKVTRDGRERIDSFSKHLKTRWKVHVGNFLPAWSLVLNKICVFETIGKRSFGSVYAIDFETGKQIWKKKLNQVHPPGITVSQQTVAYCDYDTLRVLDLNSGKEKWKFKIPILQERTFPLIFHQNVLFKTGSICPPNPEGINTINSINLINGNLIWTFKTRSSDVLEIIGSNNTIFIVTEKAVYALESFSGKLRWTFQVESNISTGVLIKGQTIYVGCTNGNIYAIDCQDGQKNWSVSTGGSVLTLSHSNDHPLFAVSSEGFLYGLSILSGQEEWRFRITQADVISAPIISNETIYFSGAANGFFVYAISLRTRMLRWKFNQDHLLGGHFVLSGNKIFIGGGAFFVYILDAYSGDQLSRLEGFYWVHPRIYDNAIFLFGRDGFLYAMEVMDK